jgi:FkbM family methyltransferase
MPLPNLPFRSMQLHKPSLASRLGKAAAGPLSRLACSSLLCRPARLAEAYLNFLLGKGSGAGWNLDAEVAAAARRVRRSNPVLFDVGANEGNWSQGMLRRLPSARVFLFDPSPGCQAVIRDKKLPGATLIPCALGEQAGQTTYYSSSATDGSASLYVRRDTPFQELKYQSTTVEVRTLDDIIDSFQIDFVDFLKMDIEGHEVFALRGAKRALAARKIRAFSFEFGCGNINSRTFFRDLWELANEAGFALWRVTPGGKEIRVDEYYEDLEYFRGATNYLAILNPDT